MASIRKRTGKKGTTYNVEIRMKGAPPQRASFKSLTKAKAWVQTTESAIRDGRHFVSAEAKKYTVKERIACFQREATCNAFPIKSNASGFIDEDAAHAD